MDGNVALSKPRSDGAYVAGVWLAHSAAYRAIVLPIYRAAVASEGATKTRI
jgi:hypothetical protein